MKGNFGYKLYLQVSSVKCLLSIALIILKLHQLCNLGDRHPIKKFKLLKPEMSI